MKLSGQPQPLSPGKEPWFQLCTGVDGGQSRSGRCVEEKNNNVLRLPE
jgi:hypothetical protein